MVIVTVVSVTITTVVAVVYTTTSLIFRHES